MTMTFLLRRDASIATPISTRSISSLSTRSKTLITHHLSSSSSSSDADLLKVLDSEIKVASQDYKQLEKLPKGFPFTVKDKKGTNLIFLKRSYRNKWIEVLVSMPNLVTGEELDDDDDDDVSNDDEGGQLSIPLTVNISKGTGSSLELSCISYTNEIVIDTLCLRRHDKDVVRKWFPMEGLISKKRGISPITTNLLYEYMINKDNCEYFLWLKNLRWFIEK